MSEAGAAGLAIAVLAEHLTTDATLAEVVGRLSVSDRAELQTAVLEVEQAAIELRDIVAPRRNGKSTSAEGSRDTAPPGTVARDNKFAGKCQCGRSVPEGRGRVVKQPDGKWEVICYPCAKERNLT